MEFSMVVVCVAFGAALYAIFKVYNELVRRRNAVRNQFAQIDVQLERRYDLIPNLVETARGYMQHERETLDAVVAARNKAQQARSSASDKPEDAGAVALLGQAEAMLQGAMSRFMALAEAYPDLKASSTMQQLMGDLAATESEIAGARQAFNEAVTHYNNYCQSVPSNLVALPFGFRTAQWLQVASADKRENIKVSFGATDAG